MIRRLILRRPPVLVLLFVALTAVAGCTASQETVAVVDRPQPPAAEPVVEAPPEAAVAELPGARPGRFDTGKMWTFENPPLDYFEEAYGFRPDTAWFARARKGALRIPGCSASFVSPEGLIVTNHHCARDAVTDVSRPGEKLLDEGFYAATREEERKAPEMYAEQLIGIEDVTRRIRGHRTTEARRRRIEQLEQQLTAAAKERDTTLSVEIVELYHGGRYSAYTFRRYGDVRLVLAPELEVGSFGGDPDNFTYPRYSLDFSFFRLYGPDGEPVRNDVYFPWSEDGAQPGEAVFVVGNPGSTSRLNTVSQLLFERDYALPQSLDVLRRRAAILQAYMEEHPDRVDDFDLRNTLMSIQNQIKKTEGELTGLRDPVLIARRRAAERDLRAAIADVDTLQEKYGSIYQQIEELQRSKEAVATQAGAFTFFAVPFADSHVLVRSVYGFLLSVMEQRGVMPSRIAEIRKEALAIEDWPVELEERMLTARLEDLRRQLGATDPTVNRILAGRTPAEAAEAIIAGTALVDSAGFAQTIEEGFLGSGDPTVVLAQALTPLYFSVQEQVSGFATREEELNAELALARFAVSGTEVPPDATFSLRIADGIVAGYPYNGTVAPPHTTYFGMYNHYFSYGGEGTEWDLPEAWLNAPAAFDRRAPVNLVSTNDITGGNSGSPLLDRDLSIVGVVFDSNIEALPNTYLFRDERGRAISVDVRGILEAMEDIYGADRIVQELRNAAR